MSRLAMYDTLLADLDRQYATSANEDRLAAIRVDAATTDAKRQQAHEALTNRQGLTDKILARREGAYRRRMEIKARAQAAADKKGSHQ
jgi:hypothetical protein